MCAQTCPIVRYTALGLCEAVPYTNHPTATVENSAIYNQRVVVCSQLHTTQWLARPILRCGDPQIIPPLPPTAGRSSQRPHRRDDYLTHHRPKIEETVADWSIPHCSGRLTLCHVSPIYGFRRSVIDGWLLPSCFTLLTHLLIAPLTE